jgi:hypothetical protein
MSNTTTSGGQNTSLANAKGEREGDASGFSLPISAFQNCGSIFFHIPVLECSPKRFAS